MNVIQVRGRDQAGNNETPIVLAVSIDNSGPFFEVGPFPGEYCFTCSGSLTFTMTAFDEQSHINNSAIVVKQNSKDIRVLQAPGGELRNTPVVWDGRDSQGQLVQPGDYQLLFYTANYAGMFGSFGAGIRVTDVLPSVPPAAAPVVPVDPPEDAPWIVSSNPPTPTPFIPASGITSDLASIAPQVAAVPQVGAGGVSSLGNARGGIAGGKTGAAATGATALLLAAAAYIAAQQATGNLSLGKKLAELAGQWKPAAKPAAPPVGKVAPPQAPPPPPPRPRRLRWNEIPRVMPPPPPPKPVYYPAPQPKVTPGPSKSSPVRRLWPGRGGALGAYGGGTVRRPLGQSVFSSAHASVTRSNNSNKPLWQRVSAGINAFMLGRNDFLEQAGVHYKPPQKIISLLDKRPNPLMSTLASSSAPIIPALPSLNPFRMSLDMRHGLAQTLRDPQTATQNWMNNQPRFLGNMPIGIPNPLYWSPRGAQISTMVGNALKNPKDLSISGLAWTAASMYVTNKEKEKAIKQLQRVEASNRFLNDTQPGYYDNRPDRYIQDRDTTFGIVFEAQMIATAAWGVARPMVLKNPQGFFGTSIPDIATVRNGSIYLTNGEAISLAHVPKSPADILLPGGNPIGTAGSKPTIREIQGTVDDANRLIDDLVSATGGTPTQGSYPGTGYDVPSGGFVGLRSYATKSPGTIATIDVNIPGIPIDKIKINP